MTSLKNWWVIYELSILTDMGTYMSKADTSRPEGSSQIHCNRNVEWWVVVLTNSKRGVREYNVRVKEDTGTPVNWIHPKLIRSCKLGSLVEDCEPRFFEDMNGKTYKYEKCALVTWYGRKRNSLEEVFYIAREKSSIDLLLGNEFVSKYGRVSEVCADAPKIEDTRMFVATKLTVSGVILESDGANQCCLSCVKVPWLTGTQKEQRRQMEEKAREHKQRSAEVIARSQKPAGESRRKDGPSERKGDSLQ